MIVQASLGEAVVKVQRLLKLTGIAGLTGTWLQHCQLALQASFGDDSKRG